MGMFDMLRQYMGQGAEGLAGLFDPARYGLGPQPPQPMPMPQQAPQYGFSSPGSGGIPPWAFPPGGVSPAPVQGMPPGYQAQQLIPDQLQMPGVQAPGGGPQLQSAEIGMIPQPPMTEGMQPAPPQQAFPPPPPVDPMEQYLSDYNARTQEIMESQQRAARAQMFMGYGSSLLGNIGAPATAMAQGGQHISDWLGRKEQIELLPEARDAELFEQQMALMKSQGAGKRMPWGEQSDRYLLDIVDQKEEAGLLSPDQAMDERIRIMGGGPPTVGADEAQLLPNGMVRTAFGDMSREAWANMQETKKLAKDPMEDIIEQEQYTAKERHDVAQLKAAGYSAGEIQSTMQVQRGGQIDMVSRKLQEKGVEYVPFTATEKMEGVLDTIEDMRSALVERFREAGALQPGDEAALAKATDEQIRKLATDAGLI